MLQRVVRYSVQPFNLPTRTTPPSLTPIQLIPTSPSFPILKQQCRLSRRELTIFSNSCLLLLLGTQAVDGSSAKAEAADANTNESDQPEENVVFVEEDVANTSSTAQPEENRVLAEDVANTSNTAQPEANPVLAEDVANQQAENLNVAEGNVTKTSNRDQPEENLTTTPSCTERKTTKQVFLDISIDGEPAGRITVGLYGDEVPAGVDRFSKIVSGAAGISYRRKEFVKIMPNYVQHGGLRSYGVDSEFASRTGSNLGADSLVQEWEREYEKCPGTKNVTGSVGIIVRNPSKPPPKMKLVAKKGKLEIDQEEVGIDPNGTEFVIVTKDSPELDTSSLVIGRVIGGMEVVKRIGEVKTVQENTGSPYFRVAKLIGDKRAVVAERGFNRPYSKVIVTNCGLMQ
ncbi:peptidyl-prolyl cis-trans isomerase CYP26-2, chloroplastic [Vigna unguiculata]|uniref:Peptidyl-prolyl cis-trans isomerase B n=1 Tax=Vigna unguiculata TaxID=3917 RepID=A0A4D6KVU6_VIGUN|nr:peptidyl-prolyl cis-trans isomerase CYP26-2, chloroplastic [Vigna unguiculata]QCD80743.1 peptidyl-prolyl cis-trans isomerase B [Vigna unguiculata]